MDFRTLDSVERDKLRQALRANAETGQALRLNPRDTSFVGESSSDDLETERTINAIRSIPCHYGEQFTMPRTGKPPLQFSGELVAEVGGKWIAGKDVTRYHDLAIHRTDAGKLIASIEYVTAWQGELGVQTAEAFDSEADVILFFTEHGPSKEVRGYPPHESYRERQEQLLASVTGNYRDRVGELLAKANYSETIA